MDEIKRLPPEEPGVFPCGRPRPPRLQRIGYEEVRLEGGQLVRGEPFRYATEEPDISVAAWMEAAVGRGVEFPRSWWEWKRQYNSWCWAWLRAWRAPCPSDRTIAYKERDGRTLKRFRAAVLAWWKRFKVEEQVRKAALEARGEGEAGGDAR